MVNGRSLVFLLHKGDSETLGDLKVLQGIAGLHRGENIKELYLAESSKYPSIEKYCVENETAAIPLSRIKSFLHLGKLARKENQGLRVYVGSVRGVGHSESSLRLVTNMLSDQGYEVEEIRIY